ncbi:MAG: thioredoxin domain-containing protein [Candidatus Peribacter sp.]|jgi:protein-disulfide isomerase|nr:thioredoxin domain-containing protein [Candidatus Peribacter sp.]MBT4393287.1 thioredoxin domain-containing protein [Candidatus Peribacter sp.]MBT4601182.1 thioredoxin domain-containing protein [Candidatus Peribacter sp.]MBT5148858.1 thioredoxin domain-containing protein [Candidatus Peribacter sp.]MBT5637262.1 thioredoxin domain-containing protein [Candidatus Peribacter sp.]
MKRFIFFCSFAVLTACVPVENAPQDVPEQDFGEELEVEATEDQKLTIVERLLPSGLIEIGDRDADTVLLMFTEHHCRYCKDFYNEHFGALVEEFINQGTLKLQIGILPLRKYIHSQNAALGLLCAATQGKGIPMHELLFTLGAKDHDTLMSEAATLELDQELFAQCLKSPDTLKTIERQKSLARTLDVTLVPTFFLNGEKSEGLPHYADLRGMIEEAM